MAKSRAILKRRKAVLNIRKITRTMQLIATARFQKAYNQTLASKPYTKKITEMVSNIARFANVAHPLLKSPEQIKHVALLVITSNRGLCGGYNSSIMHLSENFIREQKAQNREVELEVVGKKGVAQFKFLGFPIERVITLPDEPSYKQIVEITDLYISQFIAGKIDAVYVAYMQFNSTSKQTAKIEKLLPLMIEQNGPKAQVPAQENWHFDYEFSPEADELLVKLVPEAAKVALFQYFRDAAVSEQVARMVSMKAATDNAEEMIKHLGRQANKARQTQITGELSELIGGAEALG
jgi:F-type H+-transporting ATPase subunit gamma